jgi:hypothetical protein
MQRDGRGGWTEDVSDFPLVGATMEGRASEASVRELRDQMCAAAAAEDFQRAATLQQIIKVLGPPAPGHEITLDSASPVGAESQAEFFLKHGFVVCRDVLEGACRREKYMYRGNNLGST